jgi:hypothetical protein
MPVALLAALLGSLAVHAAALFGPEVDLAEPPEPLTIQCIQHNPCVLRRRRQSWSSRRLLQSL